MTPLEIVLLILLWIFVGAFICHKRNWYKHRANNYDDKEDAFIFCTFVFAPIALIIALFREFILDDWNNKRD